jgi:hypothetical protein
VTATGTESSGFTLDAGAATSVSIAADAALNGDLVAGAAKTVTISGDEAVIISAAAAKLDAEVVITSTNTAGVTLIEQLGNDVTFTGGGGDDQVTVAGTTKTIAMGGGDDVVLIRSGTSVFGKGGSVDAGAGDKVESGSKEEALQEDEGTREEPAGKEKAETEELKRAEKAPLHAETLKTYKKIKVWNVDQGFTSLELPYLKDIV